MVLLLTLATSAAASPRILPQPSPRPLGILVRDSQSIHVLQVKSVDENGVSFKTTATLKGKADDLPFRFLELMSDAKDEKLFQAGDTVVCFCHGKREREDGGAGGTLFVRGRWALAVSPIAWRGEKNWFCMVENGYGLTYAGSTEALREAVGAVVAGREATITARAPVRWDTRGSGRLWRIKAGPAVTRFVLSDESPHFVGWGTGDPQEATKLARVVREGTARERVTAAEDLAHLGTAARPCLPALRRALADSDRNVALAAAGALVQLDADDKEGLRAIEKLLQSSDLETRYLAIRTIGDLGAKGVAALPTLLKALTDEHEALRAVAAKAVGRVAPAASSRAEALAALTALLKVAKLEDDTQLAVIGALRGLGPQSWESLPALRKLLSTPDHTPGGRSWPDRESIALLAQFDPPPVELLAELLASRGPAHDGRGAAAKELGRLGPRARLALPVLRRVLQDTEERQEDSGSDSIRLYVAEAILDIDPQGGPSLVAPVLLELSKQRMLNSIWVYHQLARCGASAKGSLPALLDQLPEKDWDTPRKVRQLASLLGPEDRKLLPQVQRLLGDLADGVDLADVLYRLGEREKALAHGTRCLEEPFDRVEAARWLGERGREAKDAEPALRRALEKASGAERAHLALTLWRVRGVEGSEAHRRALTALADLLRLCDRVSARSLWEPECVGSQEGEAVGAAVATVHDRLQGKDDPLAVLGRGLRDRDPYVRLAAAVALARVKPDHPDTVPVLRKLLEHHPHFFGYAAETLAALGPAAAPVAPLVQPLLRHPDHAVSRAAARVLRRIDPALAAKGWGAAGAPGAVPENLVPLWDDLTSDDALRADLALWRLAGAGPRAVSLLRERLRPPPALTAERVTQLIADLDADAFATRQRATSDLTEGIESAAPALRRTLAGKPSAEQRRSIQTLLDGLDPTRNPEQRRRLRAVRLLEELGGADARALLEDLSRGEERFALTREAKAALQQFDRR
jgi:HEAT repeat protein